MDGAERKAKTMQSYERKTERYGAAKTLKQAHHITVEQDGLMG